MTALVSTKPSFMISIFFGDMEPAGFERQVRRISMVKPSRMVFQWVQKGTQVWAFGWKCDSNVIEIELTWYVACLRKSQGMVLIMMFHFCFLIFVCLFVWCFQLQRSAVAREMNSSISCLMSQTTSKHQTISRHELDTSGQTIQLTRYFFFKFNFPLF